jgi:hypothetical protein
VNEPTCCSASGGAVGDGATVGVALTEGVTAATTDGCGTGAP